MFNQSHRSYDAKSPSEFVFIKKRAQHRNQWTIRFNWIFDVIDDDDAVASIDVNVVAAQTIDNEVNTRDSDEL